jgi:hypothetical protein
MDIEGAEWFALQGMRRVLHQDRPTLLMELNQKAAMRLGYDTRDIWDFLTGMGYRAWGLGLSSAESGPVTSPAPLGQQNLLFHVQDLPDAVRHDWSLKSVLRWARGSDGRLPKFSARSQ